MQCAVTQPRMLLGDVHQISLHLPLTYLPSTYFPDDALITLESSCQNGLLNSPWLATQSSVPGLTRSSRLLWRWVSFMTLNRYLGLFHLWYGNVSVAGLWVCKYDHASRIVVSYVYSSCSPLLSLNCYVNLLFVRARVRLCVSLMCMYA
jgi:hypothetical protein